MSEILDRATLEAVENCPRCGSDDLGRCGMTEERTDADYTDVIECSACRWEAIAEDQQTT